MENLKSKKEQFDKVELKTRKNLEKYDYIRIEKEGAVASLYASGMQNVKNAIVAVVIDGRRFEWKVENYRPVATPASYTLCIKGYHNAAMCAGDRSMESSYFFFKNLDEMPKQSMGCIGVVELDDFAMAFLYDWDRKKQHSLLVEKNADESELYEMMSIMRQIQEVPSGQDYYETEEYFE